MILLRVRAIFLLPLVWLVSGCQQVPETTPERLSVGVVSYGEGNRSLEQYAGFKEYLGSQLKNIIELEPAYNEIKALTQIDRRRWDLVLAPPGLAAVAISQENYVPLFPLTGVENTRSVIVVTENSSVRQLRDLAGKTVAFGQPGSATGYYLPIYNLYGLTLKKARFAPTPRTILQWLAEEDVAAGALSLADYNRYRSEFSPTRFRILHTDAHNVPTGAILVGEGVERNRQEQIRRKLSEVPPSIAAAAGFIPNGKLPDYDYMIDVVERVKPIAQRIKEEPAPLYEKRN